MSSIQDMHIFIDLELNKVNSNLYDIILPEEKDYFLNKAQERFVKDRYGAQSNNKGKGFEMSQKRIDDLRALLVPNYYDKAYLLDASDFDFDTKLRFYLPNDYWFLTSQRSKVYGNECSPIVNTSNENKVYYNIIDLSTELTNTNQFKIYSPTDSILIENLNYPIEDINLFILDLVNNWNTNFASTYGWTFYINNYYDISSYGNIIAIGTGTGQAIKYGYGETITTLNTLTYKVFNYYTSTGNQITVPNKFAQQDDVYAMQQDPFNNSNMYSPITIINGDNIDVFVDKTKFIVKEIAISYIRRPKLMSLTLNQSCELAEHTHAEILRDAVNLLLENFEATNRLQTSLQVEATNE